MKNHIILIIFVLSIFSFQAQTEIQNSTNFDSITESSDSITESNDLIQNINQSDILPAIQSLKTISESNEYILGESVQITTNYQQASPEIVDYYITKAANMIESHFAFATHFSEDDGEDGFCGWLALSTGTDAGMHCHFDIDISNKPLGGTLYFTDAKVVVSGVTGINTNIIFQPRTGSNQLNEINVSSGSYSITNIQANDVINGKLKFYMEVEGTPTSTSGFLYINVDQIIYSADDQVDNYRSQRNYVGNGKTLHKLEVINPEYDTQITIAKSKIWEFVSSTPTAEITVSGDDIVFSELIPTTYEFIFESNSSDILAISDVTNLYLEDSGFENQWQLDWEDYGQNTPSGSPYNTYGYDTLSLDNSIVFEGASSLKMENLNDKGAIISITQDSVNLPNGIFFFSFSYYLTVYSTDIDYFRIRTSNGVNLDATSPDKTLDFTLNRWHHYKGQLSILDGGYYSSGDTTYNRIQFAIQAWDGGGNADITMYLDNFKIHQVNTAINTIDYPNSEISATFHFWTAYGLDPAINENVTLQIRERSNDALISSYSYHTDSFGLIIWFWNGVFQQKEYELRAIAWNSWFGNPQVSGGNMAYLDLTASTGSWSVLAATSGVFSLSDDGLQGKSLKVDIVGNGGTLSIIRPSLLLDILAADYWTVSIKASESEDLRTNNERFWLRSLSPTLYNGWTESNSIDSQSSLIDKEWRRYIFDLDLPNEDNGIDETALEAVYAVELNDDNADAFTVYLDEIYFIRSQKSYFTPSTVGNYDYAENELFDMWDFSETGDNEEWIPYSACGFCVIENGEMHLNVSSQRIYYQLSPQTATINLNIDASYYNWFKIRIKAETSTDLIISLIRDSTGNTIASPPVGNEEIDTEYRIFEYQLDSDWNDIETDIVILIDDIVDNFIDPIEDAIIIDYISIFHKDSSLNDGYALEFSGDGYLDTVTPDGAILTVRNGYIDVDTSGIYQGIHLNFEKPDQYELKNDFDIIEIEIKRTSGTGVNIRICSYGGSCDPSADGKLTDEWSILSYHKNDWGGTWQLLAGGQLDIVIQDATADFQINWIRFLKESPPNLFESDSSLFLDNEIMMRYNIWSDSNYIGEYWSFEFIPKNLTAGTHTISYQAFDYVLFSDIITPSAIYSYSYTVANFSIMKILIHDQTGEITAFDSFKTYVDGVRLFDQFIYINTEETFNLTINDLFDNQLYSNSAESFERFKEIQISLYSVKILNIQPDPILLTINRGGLEYQEWILPNEIVKYYLETASYNFTIQYASVSGNIGNAGINGTTASLIYSVTTNTAIIISGSTIEDIFGNINQLSVNLNSVNASLHTQVLNVNISLSNQNSQIENQIINVDISLGNINSSIGTQLLSISSELINLQSNVTIQLNDIDTTLININSSVFSQTNEIISKVENINSTLYAQTINILSSTSNINSSLYLQTINILSNITNLNSSLFSQTIGILNDISNTNLTLYNQNINILSNILNINSTLFLQTISILNSISNTNSTLFSQNLQILSDILNTNSTLFSQSLVLLSQIQNSNSSIYDLNIQILDSLEIIQGLYRVHFDFIDELGLGIDWNTFTVHVNNTRIYSQDIWVSNQTTIMVESFDFYDTILFNQSYLIAANTDINISVAYFDIIFKNDHETLASIVNITRNDKIIQFEIAPQSSQIRKFTSGTYVITVYYLMETSDYTQENFTEGYHEAYSMAVTFGQALNSVIETEDSQNIIDVTPPALPFRLQDLWFGFGVTMALIFTALLTVTVGYIWREKFLIVIDGKIKFAWFGKYVQRPITGTIVKSASLFTAEREDRKRRHEER